MEVTVNLTYAGIAGGAVIGCLLMFMVYAMLDILRIQSLFKHKQRFKTQDPKYDIEVVWVRGAMIAYIVNSSTGQPIPEDEPVFMLRAKDKHAVNTLMNYQHWCASCDHISAIHRRIDDFKRYQTLNPEKVKEPDTRLT